MKSLIAGLLLTYLVCCLLLYFFQRAILYHPPSGPAPMLQQSSQISQVEFESNGQPLRGWVVNPGRQSAIIYYGGNAEPVDSNLHFFEQILPQVSVYLIPYRGYWPNEGQPEETSLYADALNIYDHLSPLHSEIGLVGRSLGSGVATHVATNRQISRLSLITPFDSIVNVASVHYPIFPVGLLMTDRFESAKRASEISAPTLVVIAGKDEVIPRVNTDQLIINIDAELLSVIELTDANHNNLSSFPLYAVSIAEFMGEGL